MYGVLDYAQILAMVMAAGTPGMTYYVMMRQDKLRVEQQKEHCNNCRSQIDKALDGYKGTIQEVESRQQVLRQETLPERYCTKREHDECKRERKEEESSLWTRLNQFVNGSKGGP